MVYIKDPQFQQPQQQGTGLDLSGIATEGNIMRGAGAVASHVMGPFGFVAEIMGEKFGTDSEVAEHEAKLQRITHNSVEFMQQHSLAVRRAAEEQADVLQSNLTRWGGGALGGAATVAGASVLFGPMGMLATLAAGAAGTLGGTMVVDNIILPQKADLVEFFVRTQEHIDARQVSGEEVFVMAALNLPKADLAHLLTYMKQASAGKIKNANDMVKALDDPQLLHVISEAKSNPMVNPTMAAVLGLNISMLDQGHSVCDKMAAILNNRSPNLPPLNLVEMENILPLTTQFNILQAQREQQFMASQQTAASGYDRNAPQLPQKPQPKPQR